MEEKVPLSERFGLWLSFYPFDQDTYLAAVAVWLAHHQLKLTLRAERAAFVGAHPWRSAAAGWPGSLPATGPAHPAERKAD